MSIYFEKKLSTIFGDVCLDIKWHKDVCLAASCVSSTDGAYVGIYDAQGALIDKVLPAGVDGSITALAWHPRGSLAVAWGVLLVTWFEGETPTAVDSPHRAPIRLLLFSQQGNRLISADTEGGLVGWNASSKQLLTGFHHQLNDQITHAVFRTPNQHGLDLQGVAKAAVAGDADALDLFTNLDMFGWRPKTAGRRPLVYPAEFRDAMAFFAASSSGMLLYLSENGRCQEVLDLDCACRDMLFRAEKDHLLILTEVLAVLQLGVLPDGSVEELMKVKLSGDIREIAPSMVWARSGTVAVNLGGQSIRLWGLDTGDNAVLSLPEEALNVEHFTALSASISGTTVHLHNCTFDFCCGGHCGVLCGATNAGRIIMWKPIGEDWVPCSSANLASPVKCMSWGQQLLAVCTLTSVHLLQEHPLSTAYRSKTGCVQKTGSTVTVWQENAHVELLAEVQIRGLSVSDSYIALYSDKSVLVYQITANKQSISVHNVGTFACECENLAVYEQSIIVLEVERVTLRTLQGTVKQILFILPTEGAPIVMSCFSQFVTVVTSEGVLRMWDINRREAKSHGQVKNLRDLIEEYGEVMIASSNSDGSRVGFIVADCTLMPNNRLYIADTDGDAFYWLDFVTGTSGVKDTECFNQDVRDRMIVGFAWDEEDPKLLVVQTNNLSNIENFCDSQIVCLWVSAEKGILLHEKINLRSQNVKLVGCTAPHVVLAVPDSAMSIEFSSLGDFSGVENLDVNTRNCVLKFSYHLATGELDLAFQAIHSVTSEAVWMNLARSCVRSKRLDVAQVCMGRMGNAHIARALRLAANEPELDARVAILAIHLGMLDEAKALLTKCNRFDLLNKLHQCSGEWDEAVKVAEVHDRMRLRTTQHQKARSMEQLGDINSALKLYEAADTHRVHAPRLLADDPARLMAYVDKSGDTTMLKWVAQLLESQGDMQGALQYYTRAHDACAIVRVLCFLSDFQKAGEVVSSTGDRAAAYHLARQFEALGRLDDALVFFSRAHAFGNAIRICKEQGTIDKIWNLALQANTREQVDAARLLLEAGDTHKAILLFQQAGEYREAIELAISCGDLEALDAISRDKKSQVDPSLMTSLAEVYVSKQQFDKAVDLLASAGKISEAVSLCTEHSVILTEELAAKLTPTGAERNKLLIEIGNCAMDQGSYHLATKKFTQAGDKERAMKALLKSGDTEKIIFLAGVSREKEVYIMAANYLQALDWRSDPQLLNTIIQFYSKARAHQALSTFYMACANVEVEEYDDLEKAVVALAEAKRCLARIGDDPTTRRAADTIERRTAILQQFIKARRAFEAGDTVEATSACRQMLAVNDPDGPVNKGKVLGLMLVNEKDKLNARKLFEELRSVVSDPTKFVPQFVLTSLGIAVPQPDSDDKPDED